MKKFLTVLLVIAVMFTFSFGSAFAAAPADSAIVTADEARADIEAEYKAAIKALDTALETYLESNFSGTETESTSVVSGFTVTEEVVKAYLLANAYADAKDLIDDEYDRISREIEGFIAEKDFVSFRNDTTGDTTYPQFDIEKYDYASNAYGSGSDGSSPVTVPTTFDLSSDADELLIEQFKAELDDAEEFVAALTAESYSDKVVPGGEDTHKEIAAELIALALKDLANIAEATGASDYAAQLKKITDIYTPAVGQEDPTGFLFTGPTGGSGDDYAPGLNNLLKKANETTAAEDLAYAKSETLNTILGDLAADKAAAVKQINDLLRTAQKAAKVDADKVKELNEALEDVNAAYDAAVEVITYLINNVETVEALGTIGSDNLLDKGWRYTGATYNQTTGADVYAAFQGAKVGIEDSKATANELKEKDVTPGTFKALEELTVEECENRAEIVDDIEKKAARDKVYVQLDGSVAIQIEEEVEDATYDAYFLGVDTYEAPTDSTILINRINALIGEDDEEIKVNGKTYDVVNDWYAEAGSTVNSVDADYPHDVNTVTSLYDEAQFDEIRALVAETKAAIRAAVTVEEADAAFLAGYAKWDAIPTAAEHSAMFTSKVGALKADYDKYELALEQLAAGIEAKVDDLKPAITWLDAGDLTTASTGYVAEVLADMQATCFTAEELKAAYDEAVVTLNNLKTNDELKAELAAVEAQLRALPKVATVADKAAVEAARAAFDAFNDYVTAVGAVDDYYVTAYAENLLTTAEEAIFDLEVEALCDEIEPLAKKVAADTLTSADAATVEALRAKIDAFVADYAAKDDANARLDKLEDIIEYDSTDINDVETALDVVIVDELVDMIAKLSVDPVDADAVAAARAAFDALTATGQLEFKTGIGTKASYDKLVALEKTIAKFDDVAAKAYLQDLSVKARSVKTKAGNVKVTVKADVDVLLENGYTVEYKFYRSTKSNKGFGKAKKVSEEATYTNTSGVKGTKYYYKAVIVAKNAEGEVVAQTPLKHCLYATRTWTK